MNQHLGYSRNFNAGFFVYKIINHVNGLQYIGCTTLRLPKRWEQHRSVMYSPKFAQKPLYQDMQKYGVEHFTIELIAECSSKFQMRRMETRHILQNNTIWPNGYNLVRGRIRDSI
jgi:predicted GIY-YIG superfamily endonuclease